MDELKLEIKKLIINSLELEDVTPEDIKEIGRASCRERV